MPETGPRRILVVDDQVDITDVLRMHLELLGYECRTAADGAGALAAARSFDPEIAIIDIGLPDMTGNDLARHLRSLGGRRVYLMALTGWDGADDRARTLDAGFDRHLVKPIDVAMIRSALVEADRVLQTTDAS